MLEKKILHLLIVMSQLLISLLGWTKLITISGVHCTTIEKLWHYLDKRVKFDLRSTKVIKFYKSTKIYLHQRYKKWGINAVGKGNQNLIFLSGSKDE